MIIKESELRSIIRGYVRGLISEGLLTVNIKIKKN